MDDLWGAAKSAVSWLFGGEEEKQPASDVVYLGLHDPAKAKESASLPGAAICDGSAKQGKIMGADGKTELDLTKEGDVNKFLQEAGVGARRKGADGELETEEAAAARIAALEDVFLGQKDKDGKRGKGMDLEARDEMAEFVQTMQKVENGEVNMKRLVISGHHYEGEEGIHGANDKGMKYGEMNAILNQFQGARDGIEDVMFSACNTVMNDPAHDDMYKQMFPNVETVWGYKGIAPSVGPDLRNSSHAHVKAWEAASRGDDEQAVSDEAKTRFRAQVAQY